MTMFLVTNICHSVQEREEQQRDSRVKREPLCEYDMLNNFDMVGSKANLGPLADRRGLKKRNI